MKNMNNDDLSGFYNNFFHYTGDYSKIFEELAIEGTEKAREEARAKDLEKNLIVNILDLLTKDGWLDVFDNMVIVDNLGISSSFCTSYNDTITNIIRDETKEKEASVEKYGYPNLYAIKLDEVWNRVDLYAAFSKEYSPCEYHIYFNSGDLFGKLILLKNSYSDDYEIFIVTGIASGISIQNIQSITLNFKGDFINDPDSLEHFKVEFGKLMSKVC